MRTKNKIAIVVLVASFPLLAFAVQPPIVQQQTTTQNYAAPPVAITAFLGQYKGDDPTLFDVMKGLKELDSKLGTVMAQNQKIIQLANTGVPEGQRAEPETDDPLRAGLEKCAVCHMEGSKRKNGDLLMFDKTGDPIRLTKALYQECSDRISGKKKPPMPPANFEHQLTRLEGPALEKKFAELAQGKAP